MTERRPVVDVGCMVVGLGVMGAAALYHLARAGLRPLGVDRFASPHTHGSSHGRSRALSLYYEEPYGGLCLESKRLWLELERAQGRRLFYPSGMLAFDARDSEVLARTVAALERQAIEHDVLDPAAVARRFPPVRIPDGTLACHMPESGFLDADRCVAALLAAACAAGAEILPPTRVQRLDLDAELPLVIGPERSWRCERLVIAPGPWAPQLLADCGWPLQPTRQYTWYFAPDPGGRCGPEQIPVLGDRTTGIYSFPEHAGGIKVALDHPGPPASPDELQPPPAPEHVSMLRRWLEDILPGGSLRSVGGETCFYTMTPDRDFVIGRHPRHERAVVAAGFSGHGFKFGAVVGRILAELTQGGTDLPIERFSPNRFGQAEPSDAQGMRG